MCLVTMQDHSFFCIIRADLSIFSSNFIVSESDVSICNQFQIRRHGHVTSSNTWPLDHLGSVSCRQSFGTEPVFPAVTTHIGVTTLTFRGHMTSPVILVLVWRKFFLHFRPSDQGRLTVVLWQLPIPILILVYYNYTIYTTNEHWTWNKITSHICNREYNRIKFILIIFTSTWRQTI